MNTDLEILRQQITKIADIATERSYYRYICDFIEGYVKNHLATQVDARVEETSSDEKKHIGFPDITVRRTNNSHLVGWWEIKLPTDSLNNDSFQEQFTKYKDSLENILFTNLREWQLWQWDTDGKPTKISELLFNISGFAIGEEKKLDDLLTKFFEGRPYEAKTPKQLALALAKKARLLSRQVEESYNEDDEESDLTKLKKTFEKTLIQDISTHQFSNMIAETMAYSLFLAFLEHIHRKNDTEITLTTAIDYLPTNVPILADLYSLVNKVSKTIPSIHQATQALIDQLNASQIEKIYQKLVEHKPGEDPVIQFYEPFLKEYDPKERKARGVYYTPKPIVDFIVRSVDYILKTKFNKPKGLADNSVYLLDPATGTGTFLMSAIQVIHANIKKENQSLGDEMVKKEFNLVVLNHILKHFYGFELLIAPYAIAHLKLTLEVERLGFDFSLTKKDNEPDNDRFKVYLANTLDNPDQPPQNLFGFNSIPQESESARRVKKDVPILAITGNPPYSNFGRMNRGEWILNLLKDYKKDLKEKKINLDDDFIKFVRFAQWKLEQTGQGIFAMITSNTFIDGITHRQMRRSLMNTFDEIYIYNLHGSSRKGEVAPDGSKDENVFNIQQGVSINIFIKLPEKQTKSLVRYSDLWGLRERKFTTLLEGSFDKTKWENIDVKEFNVKFRQTLWGKDFGSDLNLFVKQEANKIVEYGNYWGLNKIFRKYNSGIQTKRDNVVIQFDDEAMLQIQEDFISLSPDKIREKYALPEDGRDWTINDAKKDLQSNNPQITDIYYRPFDVRKTLFTGKTRGFMAYPRTEIMLQMLTENLGMNFTRMNRGISDGYFIVCRNIVDLHPLDTAKDSSMIAPLYNYSSESTQSTLIDNEEQSSNFSNDFISVFSNKINLTFIYKGRGDLAKTFGPEDVFYYIYAILYSPSYRTRYSEQLKIDFPRIPLTSNQSLFQRLVTTGHDLVNLHLLGENPFDKSKTIFDESEKWNIKVGGSKPENLVDWKVTEVRYEEINKRVYVNPGQYFEGVEKEVWEFMIGGYQVCEKWLKDRKKAERCLSVDDLKHYMKIVVSLRETIRIMKEIDQTIPKWPIK